MLSNCASLVDDSDEHDHDIGAGPAKKSRPSGQGYTGLPIFSEPETIKTNLKQPELNLSEQSSFQKQQDDRV